MALPPSLYGGDAIPGVINIITDPPTSRCSAYHPFTHHWTWRADRGRQRRRLKDGFGSYTSFTHDRADGYQNNSLEYRKARTPRPRRPPSPLLYWLSLEYHRTEIYLRPQSAPRPKRWSGLQLQDYRPPPHLIPSGRAGRHRLRDALQRASAGTWALSISLPIATRCRLTSPWTASAMARSMT